MEPIQYQEEWQEDMEKVSIAGFFVMLLSALFVIAMGYTAWSYWPWIG